MTGGSQRMQQEEPDEIGETASDSPPESSADNTAQQDFAVRNVAMSNTLGTTGMAAAAPAAGAVIGTGGDLAMEPRTEDERRPDVQGDLDEPGPGS